MAINQVLLEGRVASPRRRRGDVVEFILSRKCVLGNGEEFFPVEMWIGWTSELRAKRGDQVLVVGQLKEDSSVDQKTQQKHSRLTIRALKVKQLKRPPKVLDEEPLEEFGGDVPAEDEIPF